MATDQTLLDKDLVIEVINRMFIGTDQRDWSHVRECFTDNVQFDMSSMSGEPSSIKTPQEIVDGWDTGLKDIKSTHHQVGNYLLTITDDTATAFCYGTATHYLPNKTNQNTRAFIGSYDFHLQRVDAAWRIDQLRFNLTFIDGNQDLAPDA